MRRALNLTLRTLEIAAWTAFFVFAALVLALRYWVLPDIGQHREAIAGALSKAVGLPVKVGAIEAGWHGLRPQLTFTDMRIYDLDGREALSLPAVQSVLAWRSVVVLEPRLHLLVIERPRLAVRRDRSGAVYVAGLKLARGAGEGRGTDWILGQGEIAIRDAEIEWRDELRGAPPLALSALNLQIENAGPRHTIGVRARPPEELGNQLELRADLAGHSLREPAAWSGRLYAELGYADLVAWRKWVDYPLEVGRGQGALRVWLTADRGQIVRATTDLSLQDVAVRLAPELPVLELDSIGGRLQGRKSAQGYEVSARELALQRPGGAPLWPASFKVLWREARPGVTPGGTADTQLVELEPLAELAEFLPLSPEARKLLAELAPRGTLNEARFDWTGELGGELKVNGRAHFANLGLNAWGSVPGFAGISGSVEAGESKGSLTLRSARSEIELPAVFPEPQLRLEGLEGRIDWERRGSHGVAVRVHSMSFWNDHLAGTASGSYSYSGEGPGSADLQGVVSRGDGRHVERYLPRGNIMGDATRAWLARGIVAGEATDVRFRLRGDLRDFPFLDPAKGEFSVAIRVAKGVLDYGEGWPRIENIDADVLFERDRMEITSRSATILGARVTGARVRIPSFQAEPTVLHVDGGAAGPTQAFLDYVEKSPVDKMIGSFTDVMTARGDGKLALKLELPLSDMDNSKVAGEFQFANNTIYVDPLLPPTEAVNGRVAFTESSFNVRDLRGRFLGGPLVVRGGSRPGGGVQVVARGEAAVEGLAPLIDEPWHGRLRGTFPYVFTVNTRDGRSQMSLDSSLRGLASSLPAPLAKEALSTVPLRVTLVPADGGLRDRVTVSLGTVAAAELARRREGSAMEVLRAAVWLSPTPGQPVRLPERRGFLLYGSLAELDAESWMAMFGGGGGAATMPGTAQFDVKVGKLNILGRTLGQVSARGGADEKGWSAQVASDHLTGELAYRSDKEGRLTARLQEFAIAEETLVRKDPVPAAAEPTKLPALDLIAEKLLLRGKDLGRVEVAAEHAGQDWRIDKLNVSNPDATFTAKGVWRQAAANTTLEIDLQATDAGRLLERLGHPGQVKGGKGRLYGTVAWVGDPATFDYRTASGDLAMQVENGQFLAIDPGAGRLVSLMSLQQLPKRINMGFTDVFSQGFQFDRITAGADLKQGVLRTSDFNMRGSAADVEMQGEVDLRKETQDLKVRVLPNFGSSAAGAVAIVNPPLGIAFLIAQMALKNPVGKIFSFEYAVSGAWNDPKVERTGAHAVDGAVQSAP